MASEDIAARGDASKRVRLLQLFLGIIVCCGPNDRQRVINVSARKGATNIIPFCFCTFSRLPSHLPSIFVGLPPSKKYSFWQSQTLLGLRLNVLMFCARVSHAARILERTTHFGKQLRIKIPRVDAVLSAKFSFSRTSWKGTRSRFFSNFKPSRRTHFISSCTGKQSKRLEVIHESPIISFNAHTFHGPFPCLTIFSTRYFGLNP